MEKRIAASCGIGTGLFVAIALLFAPAYWPLALLCGAVGGAVGVYMGYDPIGVIHAIPLAWKRSIQESDAGITQAIAWIKRPRPVAYAKWAIAGIAIVSAALYSSPWFIIRVNEPLLRYVYGYGYVGYAGSVLFFSILGGAFVAIDLIKEKLTTEAERYGWGFHAGLYERFQRGEMDRGDYQARCRNYLMCPLWDSPAYTRRPSIIEKRASLRYDIPSQKRIVLWACTYAAKLIAIGVSGIFILLPLTVLTICVGSLWLLPGAIFLASRWACRFTALVCKNLFILIHCKAHTTCLIYMMGAGTTTAVYAWTAHPEITWGLYGFFVGCSSVLGAGAGIFAREVVAKRLLHLPIPK